MKTQEFILLRYCRECGKEFDVPVPADGYRKFLREGKINEDLPDLPKNSYLLLAHGLCEECHSYLED